MKNSALLLAALLSFTALPSFAQGYHKSYGNSRVVQQNQTGLYTPSATYIGAGTMSRSAQGKSAGVGAALPVVNMGSHVRTAGDNMYNDQGSMRASNGSFLYQDQYMAEQARKKQAAMNQQAKMMARQRGQQVRQQNGNFYVPGQNGSATVQAGGQTYYNPGGMSTYAEAGNSGGGGGNGRRGF
ncbi:MAG: hypothetical protein U0105_19670 [Candidatus Obscuribacterales bacterium]